MSDHLSARMRALATELTTARERAGMTLRDVSARLDISIATLSRTENALRTPTLETVAGLLGAYGVVGEDRKRIMKLVREVKDALWMEVRPEYGDLFKALINFEREAMSFFTFGPMSVPGLLQTPAYARAITDAAARTNGTTELVVEALVAERLQRQEVLNKVVSPEYTAILDEGVLRRAYGGKAVMANQIRWLVDRAKARHISVQVIPFRYGGYPTAGYFSLLEFRDRSPIVYVEQPGATGFLYKPEDVARFRAIATTLKKVALESADSVNFMSRIAADYERD
ncbi:helix-turn-helix domain-containing protein [Actinokineospora sp. HUAS TT18]|uniref:helix-turn-helix domain-containing protein n=1 Tax=Actinokineospora sp. HUAS TT18 TaxID=3447451 RepID=UPI003F51C92D